MKGVKDFRYLQKIIEKNIKRKAWHKYLIYFYELIAMEYKALQRLGVRVEKVKIVCEDEDSIMSEIIFYCYKPEEMSIKETIKLEDTLGLKVALEWKKTLRNEVYFTLILTRVVFEWVNIAKEEYEEALEELIEELDIEGEEKELM